MPLATRRAAAATVLLALLVACRARSSPPAPAPPPPVGDGSVWQLFTPNDYMGGTLAVGFPALAAGERLAVLLVNAGGDDLGTATVGVSGTGAPSLAPVAAPLASLASPAGGGPQASLASFDEPFDRSPIHRGEALATAYREETIARLLDGRLPQVRQAFRGGVPQPAALAALPAKRSFCQGRYGAVAATPGNPYGFARFWLGATLAHESLHAAFYNADEVQPGIDAAVTARTGVAPTGVVPFWGELAAAYEDRIFPALATYFGPESDVDGNGKMIFLFGNLGKYGTAPSQVYTVGYFWPGDLEAPLADATTCPQGTFGTTGNRADMLYVMDPGTMTSLADPTGASYAAVLDAMVNGDYPGVMAHELQHDVNYNVRFLLGGASRLPEETWLNEGLSKLSETVAGYGLHGASGRSAVRYYLGEPDPATHLPYHQAFSLTLWEADPRGNYAGVQAYMQYLLDHASPAMTQALENPALAGKANVEAATGKTWELGFAQFVTASMFSNEDASATPGGTITSGGNVLASPVHNYLGDGVNPDYVPWHHYTGYCTVRSATPGFPVGARVPKPRLAYVAFSPLTAGASSSATLRKDGWAAFATGPGSGAAASVTVQSTAAVPPQVVVVRYFGALPNFAPLGDTLTCQ